MNEKEIKKEKKKKKTVDIKWILIMFIASFVVTLLFSTGSELSIPKVNIIIQILLIVAIIAFAIVFDMVGVAITTADAEVFNSMNARKVKGANIASIILKNRDKFSSVVDDVIGDACGIVVGAAGVSVSLSFAEATNVDIFTSTILVTSIIAAFTISGKAFFKGIALENRNKILNIYCQALNIFYKPKNR